MKIRSLTGNRGPDQLLPARVANEGFGRREPQACFTRLGYPRGIADLDLAWTP